MSNINNRAYVYGEYKTPDPFMRGIAKVEPPSSRPGLLRMDSGSSGKGCISSLLSAISDFFLILFCIDALRD
jgi:hypothetical protein